MLIQDNTETKFFVQFNKTNTSYYYLFNLQKRIYVASKEGNLSLVCSLQKLLLSLRSIKLLASNFIERKIIEKSKNTAVKKSFTEITKKIIYWCLEAEWVPKIHHTTEKGVNTCQNKFVNLFVESFLLSNHISLSNIKYKYLKSRLEPIKVIQTNVTKLLECKELANYSKHQASQFKVYSSQTDHLYHLLVLIVVNGNHWHYFRQIKLTIPKITLSTVFFRVLNFNRYIYLCPKTINIVLVNLKNFSKSMGCISHNENTSYARIYYIKAIDYINSHNCYQIKYLYYPKINFIHLMEKELHQHIKNFLFHKDNLSRLRINNGINVYSMTNKITSLIKNFREYQIILNQKSDFSLIRKMVIDVCYCWLKKKYKRLQKFQTKVILSRLKLKLDNIKELSKW